MKVEAMGAEELALELANKALDARYPRIRVKASVAYSGSASWTDASSVTHTIVIRDGLITDYSHT